MKTDTEAQDKDFLSDTLHVAVLGFNEDGKKIIFSRVDMLPGEENRWVSIKSSLPKCDLMAFLQFPPSFITTKLRNMIWNLASKKGTTRLAYSLSGGRADCQTRCPHDECTTYRVPLEEYKLLPGTIEDAVEERHENRC